MVTAPQKSRLSIFANVHWQTIRDILIAGLLTVGLTVGCVSSLPQRKVGKSYGVTLALRPVDIADQTTNMTWFVEDLENLEQRPVSGVIISVYRDVTPAPSCLLPNPTTYPQNEHYSHGRSFSIAATNGLTRLFGIALPTGEYSINSVWSLRINNHLEVTNSSLIRVQSNTIGLVVP